MFCVSVKWLLHNNWFFTSSISSVVRISCFIKHYPVCLWLLMGYTGVEFESHHCQCRLTWKILRTVWYMFDDVSLLHLRHTFEKNSDLQNKLSLMWSSLADRILVVCVFNICVNPNVIVHIFQICWSLLVTHNDCWHQGHSIEI